MLANAQGDDLKMTAYHVCLDWKKSECDLTNAVYLLTCNVCGEQNIGETARKLRLRLREHHFQAWNRSQESPWGEHMRQHQDVVINKKPVFTAAVLAVLAHGVTRKFRESIEIHERSPKINRSKSWSIWCRWRWTWHWLITLKTPTLTICTCSMHFRTNPI